MSQVLTCVLTQVDIYCFQIFSSKIKELFTLTVLPVGALPLCASTVSEAVNGSHHLHLSLAFTGYLSGVPESCGCCVVSVFKCSVAVSKLSHFYVLYI